MKNREWLIIVDYQNDFANPDWTLYVNNWEKLLNYINWLIKEVKLKSWIIISTQDWHPYNHTSFAKNHNVNDFSLVGDEVKWPVHCVENSWWADFLDWLEKDLIDVKIHKWMDFDKECYSWFGWIEENSLKSLDEILTENKVKILNIVWLATDFCVYHTVDDALKKWYKVNLHTKWIAWVYPTPESHFAIPSMQQMWAKIF